MLRPFLTLIVGLRQAALGINSVQHCAENPQRTAALRVPKAKEIKANSLIAMEIERASAKIRARGTVDEKEDYALPVYAERIPVITCWARPEPVQGLDLRKAHVVA
jgi:hypothetical protein